MQNNYFFKREVLRFKHFSRKGYALFACLGRVVVVGVLSVATLQNAKATGISTEVFRADNDTIPTDREYSLTEIEVSGTRAPLSEGQAARMVTVLRAQDIQAAAVQSVNDLLKLCVGVDVRQRAPMGAQTDISIRGGTSEHIAILLDGICISDPQTGHNALDLPIQLSEIERVEVLEGPAARVYGAQSLLGAINIVTKKQQKATELHAEYGSYGTLSVGGVLTAFTNSISGSYSRSDGFNRSKAGRLNNDYEGSKAFYQGGYSFSPQSVMRWNFGFANKRWGSSTSYGLG
ncbi:MAG: TonB-dependent receptor, partial [Prevotella sp.]|nr:TonB-dependent receptor [Prevotella sp.]